jgi:sporulation protein YlmC with PRC-barrel domain
VPRGTKFRAQRFFFRAKARIGGKFANSRRFPATRGTSARYRTTTKLEEFMTTSSGHTSAILASRVKGTAVYDGSGDKIGTVEDVVLDKTSNRIMFAALGFGGILGMGEKYCPVPWSLLNYDENKGGYVVPLTKDRLKTAPAYELKDLTKHDGSAGDSLGNIREETYSYYNVSRDWQ